MYDLLKTAIALLIILYLIRRKTQIGIAMAAGGCVIGLLYQFPIKTWITLFINLVSDFKMIEVIAILQVVLILESILRNSGRLVKITDNVMSTSGNKRIAISLMPAIIGLLPSAGGARFSAPMVDELTKTSRMSADMKVFINYWFRHLWEYASPIYPGILLVTSFLNIESGEFILYLLPYPVLMIITGWVVAYGNKDSIDAEKSLSKNFGAAVISLWPIFSVILIVVLFKIKVSIALFCIVTILFIIDKQKPHDILDTITSSFNIKMATLIAGIFLFKHSLQISDSLTGIGSYLSVYPKVVVLFTIPFISGLATGITVGFIALSFPLLIAIYGQTGDILPFAFAFVAGFNGVMLSPVHLCLLLTKDYFNADLLSVYKLILPPTIIICLFSVGYYLIGVKYFF